MSSRDDAGEPFRYTCIPYFTDEKGAKRPSLQAGFTYEGFGYGSVAPPDPGMPHHGWGRVGSRASGLIPVDIDNMAGFPATSLGKLLSPVMELLLGTVKAGGRKRHLYLDGRNVPDGYWPGQWATAEWPYDIKTAGFVRGEPDYLPHPGIMLAWTPEMTAAVETDRAEYRMLFPPRNSNSTGTATGAVSSWNAGAPEASITDDNTLSAAVMKMACSGMSRDEAYSEWLRIQCPLDGEWTDSDFGRHWSGKVEEAYQAAADAIAADRELAEQMGIDAAAMSARREDLIRNGSGWVRKRDLELTGTRAFTLGDAVPEPGANGSGNGHGNGNGHGTWSGILPGDSGRPPTPYQQMAAGGPFVLSAWDETQVSGEILVRTDGHLRYAPDIDGWIADRGPVWETVDAGTYVAALGQLCPLTVPPLAPSPAEEAEAKRKNDARHRLRSNAGNSALARQMALVAGANGRLVRATEIDSDPEIIWAGGRLFSLRTLTEIDGRGLPHLKNAPWAPDAAVLRGADPREKAPFFMAMMEAVFPDPDIREWVILICGHLVKGGTDKHAAVIELRGETNCGKSSFARCVSEVLGFGHGYAVNIEDDLFDGSVETARAFGRIPGSRLAYLDEWSDRKGKISRTRLKKLTGGQRFEARLLYANPAEFEPHHTFMVSLNPEVSLPYEDAAVQSRTVSIPFGGTDLHLIGNSVSAALTALPQEAPAVLAMLMRSAQAVLAVPAAGTMADAPSHAARQFREVVEENRGGVADWLDDVMRYGPDVPETNIKDLIGPYNEWAKMSNREQVPNTKTLGRRLGKILGSELHREGNGERLWKVARRTVGLPSLDQYRESLHARQN